MGGRWVTRTNAAHRICERHYIGGKFVACRGSLPLSWRCSFRWPLLHKRLCPFRPRTEAKFTPMFTEEVTEGSCWLTGVVSTRRAGRSRPERSRRGDFGY